MPNSQTTPLAPCDPQVYKCGVLICTFHAKSAIVEMIVARARAASGQRVDWHYVGGYANVKCIGDVGKAREAINAALVEKEGLFEALRWYE